MIEIVIGVAYILSIGTCILFFSFKGRKAVIVSIMTAFVLLCTCHNCYLKGREDTRSSFASGNSAIDGAVTTIISAYQVSLGEEK